VAVKKLGENIKRRMIVGTKEMLVRWVFLKGAVAARHSHPHEQIVVMVHGKLRLTKRRTNILRSADPWLSGHFPVLQHLKIQNNSPLRDPGRC
jgi:hypothetical protein